MSDNEWTTANAITFVGVLAFIAFLIAVNEWRF